MIVINIQPNWLNFKEWLNRAVDFGGIHRKLISNENVPRSSVQAKEIWLNLRVEYNLRAFRDNFDHHLSGIQLSM
jgi:hypothetical protein